MVDRLAMGYPSLGFDPAPGDADRLDEAGAAWQSLGERLGEQAEGIRALHAGIAWTGRAADACLSRLHVVPADVQTAADACRTAGRTLRRYADQLRALQRSASSLESAAEAHLRAARTAAQAEDTQAAQRQLTDVLHRACLLRDEADAHARDVAAILAAARADAPHSPGWFHRMLHDLGSELHHVAGAMHDLVVRYAPQIAAVAAWCSKAASVLAEVGFFVSLVPGLGDAVGSVIILASIGLGTTALLGHSALAAAGVGSWKSVAFDGASLAVSLVSRGMDAPIERAAEDEAAVAATRPAPWRDLPSMSQREFTLRAVKLHVDGAGASLGTVDLAHLGEDWPVMQSRRRVATASGAA